MAFLAAAPFLAALSVAATTLSAAGTLAAGGAAKSAGEAQQSSMDYRAAQEEQAAQESRAVGQRRMFEKQREGRFALSALQARAAAGGGGADDPTVLNLGGDIAARSEYDALFEMYKGENRALGLEGSAVASRMSGDAAAAEGRSKKTASYLSAGGTILGGIGSAYRTYKNIPSERYG